MTDPNEDEDLLRRVRERLRRVVARRDGLARRLRIAEAMIAQLTEILGPAAQPEPTVIDPAAIGAAARRLAAKMVADQAIPLMCSYVSLGGDPNRPEVTDATAVVVVARGPAALKAVMDFAGKPRSVEIEGR